MRIRRKKKHPHKNYTREPFFTKGLKGILWSYNTKQRFSIYKVKEEGNMMFLHNSDPNLEVQRIREILNNELRVNFKTIKTQEQVPATSIRI